MAVPLIVKKLKEVDIYNPDEPASLIKSLLKAGQLSESYKHLMAAGVLDAIIRLFKNIDLDRVSLQTKV